MSKQTDRGGLAGATRLWHRALHWRRDELVAHCDRVGVLSHVHEASRLAPRYVFMIVLSCGIATLGLLQNSVAVIIGAMLISPLMSPIVELGMGLATFDFRTVRQSLRTVGAGLVPALFTAVLIVRLSPIQGATPEILARTSPTLFDLLVAIFSGLAGAYATITRKGETIVGVAIATALMPPIAVVGYGLALAHWDIARGAAFLFMTNLLAIALSVTIVARIYGFGGQDTPKQTVWQAVLIIAIFAVLSVPLGLGLKRIAEQSRARAVTRTVLERTASQLHGRITGLRVDQDEDGTDVDAVLTAPRHAEGLEARLRSELTEALPGDVHLNLLEVATTSDASIAEQQASLRELRESIDVLRRDATDADLTRAKKASDTGVMQQRVLRQFGTFQTASDGTVRWFRLSDHPKLDLRSAYELERAIHATADARAIGVVPAIQPLPDFALPSPAAPKMAMSTQDGMPWTSRGDEPDNSTLVI